MTDTINMKANVTLSLDVGLISQIDIERGEIPRSRYVEIQLQNTRHQNSNQEKRQ